MKVKYHRDSSTFDVPKYSALTYPHYGWKDAVKKLKKGDFVTYCKNRHGKYAYGTTDLVEYVDPDYEYVVVLVDTPVDSWHEILTSTFDVIALSPEELLAGMEESVKKMRNAMRKCFQKVD